MKNQKGFTIIELIVVIAIIAVLAGIVLVNVTQYVNKSKDAAIKGNMAEIYLFAGKYFEANSTYDLGGIMNNVCEGEDSILNSYENIIAKIAKNGDLDFGCGAEAPRWAACTRLNYDQNKSWCVDNTGAKMEIAWTRCSDIRAHRSVYSCQ